MIEDCVTYDSNSDLQELVENCALYVGRLFSIRIMNLDGVFSPAYYTALMVRHNGSVGFLVMFDDSKKFYLNKFQFIELQYVTSFTLFTNNDKHWYERFMPYINSSIVSDFITRMEVINGDVSICLTICEKSQIMVVKSKTFQLVFSERL